MLHARSHMLTSTRNIPTKWLSVLESQHLRSPSSNWNLCYDCGKIHHPLLCSFSKGLAYVCSGQCFSILLLSAVPTPAQLWPASTNTKLLQIQTQGDQGGLLQVCQEIQLLCAQQGPQLLGHQVAKQLAAQCWQRREHALFRCTCCTGWKYSLKPLLSFTMSSSQLFHQRQTTPSQQSVWQSF